LTGWSLREIDALFAGHELPPPVPELDASRWPVVGGSVRRELAARYHAAIDTRGPTQRARLLRVYDEVIRAAPTEEGPKALAGALRADGVRFRDDGLTEASELAIESSGVVDEAAASLATGIQRHDDARAAYTRASPRHARALRIARGPRDTQMRGLARRS
jgi:hypothetical protein